MLQRPAILLLATSFLHPLAAGTRSAAVPPEAAPADDMPEAPSWEVTGAAGLALTDGNSDSLAYNIRFLASRFSEANETWMSADYHYADDDGEKSTDTLRLGIQHDHKPGGPFYFGGTAGFLADPVADLDHRFDLGAHGGWHAFDTGNTRLSFEAGPGYAWEKQGGVSDDYMSLRFAQRMSHRLNSRARLTQSIVFTTEAADFSNHLLVGEAAFAMRLTDRLALNTALRHSIDNTPAAGRRKNDTTLVQGLSYILGGQPGDNGGGGGSRRSLMPSPPSESVSPAGWTAEAALGLSLAQGNSDTLNLTFTTDTAHRGERGEFFLNTAYTYAENSNVTSIDALRVSTKYNRFIDGDWYAGANLGFFRDPLADIEYRVTPGAHLGRYLVRSDDTTLSIEAGPGVTFENAGKGRDEYASATASQRLAHNLTRHLRLNQAVIYQVELGEPENFTVLATGSVDLRINDRLSWRNAASWHFDNRPAPGKERRDTTLTSGLAYRF